MPDDIYVPDLRINVLEMYSKLKLQQILIYYAYYFYYQINFRESNQVLERQLSNWEHCLPFSEVPGSIPSTHMVADNC